MVMDCWTDNYKRRAFVNYRIHYRKNFELNVITLKTEIFPHPHTATRLKDHIKDTLDQYKLENKTIIAVTDNGANIVKALSDAKVKRMPCSDHSLHLFLSSDVYKNKDLSALPVINLKMKTIVKALTYKCEELANIREMRENTPFCIFAPSGCTNGSRE